LLSKQGKVLVGGDVRALGLELLRDKTAGSLLRIRFIVLQDKDPR